MSEWNDNTNSLSLTFMSNYYKLHLQTYVLKNPYDLPLPKYPISFLEAILVRVILKCCLWGATISPLLPNKRPLINSQLAWLSASSSHTVTRASSSSLTSTENHCLELVFDLPHWILIIRATIMLVSLCICSKPLRWQRFKFIPHYFIVIGCHITT